MSNNVHILRTSITEEDNTECNKTESELMPVQIFELNSGEWFWCIDHPEIVDHTVGPFKTYCEAYQNMMQYQKLAEMPWTDFDKSLLPI